MGSTAGWTHSPRTRSPFPWPGVPRAGPSGTLRAPRSKPPSDTLTLSPQGPAGLEGLDGKDGKPGLRVRLWGIPACWQGGSPPPPPQDTPNPYLFLSRVTPDHLGHQG